MDDMDDRDDMDDMDGGECVDGGPGAARLLIGNQAIDFRLGAPEGWHFLDLGEEWMRCTGLPFVFALWMLRADLPRVKEVAAAFRELGRRGLERIGQIVDGENFHTREFRLRYLTEHIRYGLGEREKAGVELFRELLVKHGCAPRGVGALRWV